MSSPTPGTKKRTRKKLTAASDTSGASTEAVTPQEMGGVGPIDDARQRELAEQDARRLGQLNAVQEMVASITNESGDVNAEKLRDAMRDALANEASTDNEMLAHISVDETKLRAALDQLRTQRDEIESKEKLRAAKSSLALEMIVTGCEFATTHMPDASSDETLPRFTMHRPCVIGKSGPDNDCRMCIHHTRTVLDVPQHQKRYPRSGLVIPITNQQEADALAYFLKATGMLQPRHVDTEIHFIETTLARIAQTREELRRREAERTVRGPQFR